MTDTQKDRLRLLVAALRSGDYTQAVGQLRTDEGYCCLGVACDVFHRETDNGFWSQDYKGGSWFFYGNSYTMGVRVYEWFGLPSQNPTLEHGETTMSGLNDNLRLDFSAIADQIEEEYEL